MRRVVPLLDHPELTLIEYSAWREYRVDNPRLIRRGAGTVKTIFNGYWADAAFPLLLACLWPSLTANYAAIAMLVVIWSLYVYVRCTQVLWESVIVIPALGLQLETHRGFSPIPLFATRRFIPLSMLQDFIINEGLHGWNIHYYLAAIQRSQHGIISLQVAYENILPRFPVLLEVYRGVHSSLLSNTKVPESGE